MFHSKGFTFIEMVFIMFIVSIFMILFIPNMIKTIEKQQTAQFFEVFSSDILYIQNQSLRTNDRYRIILNEGHYTIIKDTQFVQKREYPKHLKLLTNTNLRISFTKSGTITNPMTIKFEDRYHKYQVVFPFGKGRHYIEET